jgi:hypothetical protein
VREFRQCTNRPALATPVTRERLDIPLPRPEVFVEMLTVHHPSSPRLASRIVRAGVLVTLEVCVAIALLLAIRTDSATPSPEPDRPLSTVAVAAEPKDYRAAPVRVQGAIAERPLRLSERDRGAFVLEGEDERARLLVVFADDNRRHPRLKIGTDVVVHGTVVIPPDSRRLARRVTSRTAIAKRTHSSALLKATRIELAR